MWIRVKYSLFLPEISIYPHIPAYIPLWSHGYTCHILIQADPAQ